MIAVQACIKWKLWLININECLHKFLIAYWKKNDPTKWPEVEWGNSYNYLIEALFFILFRIEVLFFILFWRDVSFRTSCKDFPVYWECKLILSDLGKIFRGQPIEIFFSNFLVFPRKQNLTFHANGLQWRQFAWNVNLVFWEKQEKYQFIICWISPENGKGWEYTIRIWGFT